MEELWKTNAKSSLLNYYWSQLGNKAGEREGGVPAPHIQTLALLSSKDTGTEDTISQFGRRNQMSSSNTLSIHGLKKEHQFQDSNRDIQW
jgi:hypothetical protein